MVAGLGITYAANGINSKTALGSEDRTELRWPIVISVCPWDDVVNANETGYVAGLRSPSTLPPNRPNRCSNVLQLPYFRKSPQGSHFPATAIPEQEASICPEHDIKITLAQSGPGLMPLLTMRSGAALSLCILLLISDHATPGMALSKVELWVADPCMPLFSSFSRAKGGEYASCRPMHYRYCQHMYPHPRPCCMHELYLLDSSPLCPPCMHPFRSSMLAS